MSIHLGLASNFYFFALLNLAGAVLVYFTIQRVQPMHAMPTAQSPLAAMIEHWRNPALRAAFGIGFCILFAFIGTFTFVNFVLVRPPLSLGRMDLGFVYFVFLPSVVTTLLAGKAVARFGTRPAIWGALAVAAIGLPLMLSSHLAEVLAGMVLVGAGTFFAQASATGFVGQAAPVKIAAWRAGPISPAISLAALSAARCSANCSTASDGLSALPASAHRWPSPVCSPHGSHFLPDVDASTPVSLPASGHASASGWRVRRTPQPATS